MHVCKEWVQMTTAITVWLLNSIEFRIQLKFITPYKMMSNRLFNIIAFLSGVWRKKIWLIIPFWNICEFAFLEVGLGIYSDLATLFSDASAAATSDVCIPRNVRLDVRNIVPKKFLERFFRWLETSKLYTKIPTYTLPIFRNLSKS